MWVQITRMKWLYSTTLKSLEKGRLCCQFLRYFNSKEPDNNEQESSFQWFSFPMFGCFSWNFRFRVAESCVGELCRFDGYRERIIPLFDGELSGAACCVSNTEFSYWNSGISNCRLCFLKILGGFSSCSVCQLNHVNPPDLVGQKNRIGWR